jgi:hypothetical protein
MFGVEYITAFIGVAFQFAFAVVSAIIFRPAWNCVASNYLNDWLPEKFLELPYWHVVAIILTCSFIGEQIKKLTPKIINISNDSKSGS